MGLIIHATRKANTVSEISLWGLTNTQWRTLNGCIDLNISMWFEAYLHKYGVSEQLIKKVLKTFNLESFHIDCYILHNRK